MDWLNKLKEYAPDIAAAFVTGGASLPTLALKAVSDALGKPITSTKELAQAVNEAPPEIMLELTKANNSFNLEMEKLATDLKKTVILDKQAEHHETQETIRNGDNSTDQKIRWVRPHMAIKSWWSTIAYCLGCTVFRMFSEGNVDIFDIYIAGFLATPAWAYLGLRTTDKIFGKQGVVK